MGKNGLFVRFRWDTAPVDLLLSPGGLLPPSLPRTEDVVQKHGATKAVVADTRGARDIVSVVAASLEFTIAFDEPDEDGWIVARVLEVPGALSQGRSRGEARENVLDALATVLTPDEELAGESPPSANVEHLRFVVAA